MKQKIFFIGTLFLLLLVFNNYAKEEKWPVLKGPYLGQKPPGMTPEIFAPGIISTNKNEFCSCFTQDGRFFIFSRSGIGIVIMEQKNDVWTAPYKAPFYIKGQDGDFTISPDGKKIFIASGRPLSKGAPSTRNHNIWIVKKQTDGWSRPQPLDYPINTDWHESYPSVTDDETLYFFKRIKDPDGIANIYKSKLVEEKYVHPEKLGGKINTRYNDLDSFIARDESYIIFCSERPGGYGESDFYVSFQKKEDLWTEPVNMGNKINSLAAEWIPSVTPDGKYFFFTSNKSGNREIYWVDAKIIEQFKPKEL